MFSAWKSSPIRVPPGIHRWSQQCSREVPPPKLQIGKRGGQVKAWWNQQGPNSLRDGDLPSGKLTVCQQFSIMAIEFSLDLCWFTVNYPWNMVIFHSYLYVYQRVAWFTQSGAMNQCGWPLWPWSHPRHMGKGGWKLGTPETGWFNSKEQVNSGWLLKLGCARRALAINFISCPN